MSNAPVETVVSRSPYDVFVDNEDYGGAAPSFDVRKVVTVVRANLWLIGLIVAISVALALAVTMLQTPRYTAQVSVQINNQSDQVLSSDQGSTNTAETVSAQDTERFLKTQIDILSSRAMAERVAQRLRLFGNARFYEAMGVSAPASGTSNEAIHAYTLELLIEAVKADLPQNSRLATISFTSNSPAFSAQVANAWASEFIQANLQRRYDSSAYAREFIAGQLAEAKTKLEQSENDLNTYARKVGIIRVRESGGSGSDGGQQATTDVNPVTMASLLQLNTSANQATATRIAAQQRLAALSGNNLLSAPEVLANSTVASLMGTRASAEADLQRERMKHLDDYPTIVQLKAQVATINQQINAVAQSIRGSVKQQYDAAVANERTLQKQVSTINTSAMAEQDQSVQYNLLALNADTNRSLYDGLLQRFKELNAAAGISASNIAVIDNAAPPVKPSSPILVNNVLIGLFAGLVLAALVVLIRFQFDDAVRVPEDVEEKLGMPLLGVIPKVQDATSPGAAMADPKSAMSEGYNSLRSALLYSSAAGLPRTLLVTSSQPAEGKSTTSYAIAMGLARLGRTVALLDADMRRPALHTTIGVQNDRGMSSLLTAQHTVDEVLQPTANENLQVVTSGPIPPSPTELLSSGRLTQVLAELRERFDVVVIDSPPVLGLADAPLMSAVVDGVVMVVQSDRSRRGSLRASLRRLRTMQPNVLGAVLTMFDASKVGNRYSEYYGYNYYRYSSDTDA